MYIALFYDIIQNSAFIIMKGYEFLIQKREYEREYERKRIRRNIK